MIIDQTPQLILPDHYQLNKPAIIRPFVDVESYFPVKLDRQTRRAIMAELEKIVPYNKNNPPTLQELVNAHPAAKAAIPFGMFTPPPYVVAYPTKVQDDSAAGAALTNVTIAYTGTVAAGELILFVSGIRNTGAVTISSGPAGFTQLITSTPAANLTRICVYYKIAVGGETSSTITYSAASNIVVIARRYSGVFNAAPATSTVATANSTTATYNNVAPSWGSTTTKWLSIAFSNSSSVTPPAPTSFVNQLTTSNSGNIIVAMYDRDLTAANLTPSSVTVASAVWATYALAVRPA